MKPGDCQCHCVSELWYWLFILPCLHNLGSMQITYWIWQKRGEERWTLIQLCNNKQRGEQTRLESSSADWWDWILVQTCDDQHPNTDVIELPLPGVWVTQGKEQDSLVRAQELPLEHMAVLGYLHRQHCSSVAVTLGNWASRECNVVAQCAGNRLKNLVSEPDCRLRKPTVCQENISEAFIWERVYIIGRLNTLPSCSNMHFMKQTHAHAMLVNRWGTGGRPRCGSVLAPAHSRGELLILRWKDYTEGDFPASSQEKKSGFIKENKSQLQINLLYSIVSCFCSCGWFSLWKALVALPWWLRGFVGSPIDLALLISLTLFHIQLSEEKWPQSCEHRSFCKSWNPQFPIFFFFLTRQLCNFFTSLLFLTYLQTPISHPPLSILSSFLFMMFLFHLQGSKNILSKPTLYRSQNSKPFFYLTDLTLDFWLTLFINLATSDLAGAPPTLKGQAWEANGNLQIFFL